MCSFHYVSDISSYFEVLYHPKIVKPLYVTVHTYIRYRAYPANSFKRLKITLHPNIVLSTSPPYHFTPYHICINPFIWCLHPLKLFHTPVQYCTPLHITVHPIHITLLYITLHPCRVSVNPPHHSTHYYTLSSTSPKISVFRKPYAKRSKRITLERETVKVQVLSRESIFFLLRFCLCRLKSSNGKNSFVVILISHWILSRPSCYVFQRVLSLQLLS